jgi:hypothetical protein
MYKEGSVLISKLREHMNFEDEVLYRIPDDLSNG